MVCQECNQRPATLHFTKIINGEKEQFHLCEHCAQEKGDIYMFNNTSGFSINNLLAGLFNIEPNVKQQQQNPFQQQEVLQCNHCSMTLNQFLKVGRFGCSHCYSTFKEELDPIFKRLHGGNWTHHGKIPKRVGGTMHIKKNIEDLKNQLQQLIANEEFEKAALVRDEIRLLDQKLDHSSGGGN
ncbi:UvrB/UvrC motif-containing protein [Niallia sp. XMNu-256]|uniref:UvrB/UvrC motif-containing protein n=1 Tax=Niallia sp. XMNu-256 TaxID=3082444 RepID=UPI0030D48047